MNLPNKISHLPKDVIEEALKFFAENIEREHCAIMLGDMHYRIEKQDIPRLKAELEKYRL